MASEVKLHALIPRKSRDEPVDQTSGAWFPSLKLIASQALAKSIIKRISTIGAETGLWKTDPWIEFQTLLHESLPQMLLEEIYRDFFEFFEFRWRKMVCRYCNEILKNVVNFNLWHELVKANNIEHYVIAWKLFHKPDVPFGYFCDIKYFSNHSLYVTRIKLDTTMWSLEDMEESLKGLPHLRSIHMTYSTEDRDGKEFELLQSFCKLEKFGIEWSLENLLPTCQFIKFLESQSNSLKELTLHVTIEHQRERFWDVLTHMSNLRKLNWHSNFMNEIREIPDLKPCQQISSLRIYLDEDQDIETLETEQLFPNLDNLHLGCLEDEEIEMKDAEIMKKVTTLDFISKSFPIDPFELMSFVPNSQKLYLVTDIGSPSDTRSLLPVMLHLSELHLEIEEYPITQDEFSALFRSLPNIVKMWLILAGLSSYQEERFINFVDASVNSLKKLHVLHLQFYDHPPSMTGKTVCAIVKNSCLKEFQDLSKFKFTTEDFEHLKTLACKQQLVITPMARNGQLCHHHGHTFHNCEIH